MHSTSNSHIHLPRPLRLLDATSMLLTSHFLASFMLLFVNCSALTETLRDSLSMKGGARWYRRSLQLTKLSPRRLRAAEAMTAMAGMAW